MAADYAAGSAAQQTSAVTIQDRLKEVWRLLSEAAIRWYDDNAMRLSAAVAMYTILSLSPLLVITIKVLALVLGQAGATRQVEMQVAEFLGPTGTRAVEGMITETVRPTAGILLTVISLGFLLLTASGVFAELRDSLNALWGIARNRGGDGGPPFAIASNRLEWCLSSASCCSSRRPSRQV